MTVESAAALRNTTGMTWQGYRQYSLSQFHVYCHDRCKMVPIELPYGGGPPLVPRTHKLIAHEKEIASSFGLQESRNGITAWCDVKKVLELGLDCFPVEQLPMDKIIHSFFGADAFRQYKQNNTKMVLAVCKPYLERVDANGRRMQGWALNSKDNNVRMCIYEGGDCYAQGPRRS